MADDFCGLVADQFMAYSNFTMAEIEANFDVIISLHFDLFKDVPPKEMSDWLRETLQKNTSLAVGINTEKARSEMLVTPILIEIYSQAKEKISLFSGVDFTVDAEKGLNGICDFLISLSPKHFYIEAPVIALVEAKKNDLQLGLPQCIAEMLAARIFNERANKPLKEIYGIVTTGSSWQFMRYVNDKIEVDAIEYSIETPEKILGILWQMISAN